MRVALRCSVLIGTQGSGYVVSILNMFGFYVVCGSVGASDIVVHGLKFHSVPTWGFISMRLTVPVKWQSQG